MTRPQSAAAFSSSKHADDAGFQTADSPSSTGLLVVTEAHDVIRVQCPTNQPTSTKKAEVVQ